MTDPDIYIELGGGSAARSLAHRKTLRRALRVGIDQFKRVSGTHLEDARICEDILTRAWTQEASPFYAYVTKREYRALSRALRARAYGLAGEAREAALLGVGNVAYQEFRTAVVRSRKLTSNHAGMEARARMMLDAGLRQAN